MREVGGGEVLTDGEAEEAERDGEGARLAQAGEDDVGQVHEEGHGVAQHRQHGERLRRQAEV